MMPLHGKIVVIKRSGGDGTEFPLTASCLFGRKPDCDIRIQLPQVSKEHCKIEFNENKEVILTNLSSVNPTRVNGEVLQQSERLKHGDLITIIDRSFRFEYPPAPTPKKRRSSTTCRSETLQVLQDKQTRDTSTVLSGEKRILELTTDSCLKDETNSEKFQSSLEQSVEVNPKEEGSLEQSKASSPFCELYQMIKQNLDSKTPWKTFGSQPQTPASSLCTPKPVSVKKVAEVKSTPKTAAAPTTSGETAVDGSTVDGSENVTPKSARKQRKSIEVACEEMTAPEDDKKVEETPELATPIQETPKNKRRSSKPQTPVAAEHGSAPVSEKKMIQGTPQKFTVSEVIEQITGCPSAATPKTPTRRRSTEATPIKPASTDAQDGGPVSAEQVKDLTESPGATPKLGPVCSPRTSPRTVERKLQVQDVVNALLAAAPTSSKQKKRKSKDLETKLSSPMTKRKRVSFGGNLSPELFDKRLPSDSPLRKGAAPRRSLCEPKRRESLLRRASVIGLIKEFEDDKTGLASPKGNKSPKRLSKTPSPKKSPVSKAKTPSPKKTPVSKAKTPSPKKTPVSKAKTPSPKKTPVSKAKTPSPSKEKSPISKAKTPSPARGRSPSPAKSQPVDTPSSKKTPAPRRQSKMLASAAETPVSLNSTPTVQGRFSISRVNTPSPAADQEADAIPPTAGTATPQMTPRRKSMKGTAKKTSINVMRNAVEVLRRRSGVSRASMKIVNSWADIVKFGQTKSKGVVPAKKIPTRGKVKKAVVPKPKTPARKLKDYASTGHAQSPVTIVVGKAHKREIQPVCAAPTLVHNIAVLKKNMKMDEDLSGVAEIFNTPASDRQTKSISRTLSATKTPMMSQSTCVNEMLGMNTPEETGEMVVSPLSVVSTATRGKYSSEAVTRFLQEEEASFVSQMSPEEESPSAPREALVVDMSSDDPREPQCTGSTTAASTPQQKPEKPDGLTGTKRIVKTPRQKPAPMEDLRGKLLKTPRQQKPEQPECLTGVRRIMKTPKQKAAPVEDLRGKLLKTPRAPKVSEEAGLGGVKELLQTPKCEEKPPHHQQAQDPEGTCVEQQAEDGSCVDVSPDAEANMVSEDPEVPFVEQLEDMSKTEGETSPDAGSDVTTEEQGVTCVEQAKDVSANAESNEATEDPEVPFVEQLEGVSKTEGETSPDAGSDVTTEEQVVTCVEQAKDVSADAESNGATEEPEVPFVEQLEDVSKTEGETSPDAGSDVTTEEQVVTCVEQAKDVFADAESNMATEDGGLAQPAEEETSPAVAPDTTEESEESSEERPPKENTELVASACDVAEVKTTRVVPVSQKKPTRGRKAQTRDHREAAVETGEHPDTSETPARGRRGKKSVVVAEAPVEPVDCVAPQEDAAEEPVPPKPRRGRKPQQASEETAEAVQEDIQEPETQEIPPQESVGSEETAVVEKPRRGRKSKQASIEQSEMVVEDITHASGEPIPAAEKEPQVPVKARRGRTTNQDLKEKVEVVVASVDVPLKTAAGKEPVVKPRRGRKAKQDSEEQPETEETNATESQQDETPALEKEESPVPVAKPRRGRKVVKQPSVEQVEFVEEKPVEPAHVEARAGTVAVQEQVAEKPKRGGRKAKQVPEPVAAPETAAPRRGRRATKQENEVVFTTEATEERNQTQEEEAVGDVPARDGESEHAGVLAEEQPEEAVVKTVRGRKGKSAAKEEVSQATPAKRGRKAATKSVPETAAAPKDPAPPARSRARGRAEKNVNSKEVAAEPVEIPLEPVKKGRRTARSTNALAEDTATAPASQSTPEVNAEPDVAPVEVKRGRGRTPRKVQAVAEITSDEASEAGDVPEPVAKETKRSKKSVNWKANSEVAQETNASPVVKGVRGKRLKVVVERDDVLRATATKKACRTKVESEESTKVTVSKPVNKRKATASKAKEDLNIETDVPVKRGRRGAKAPDAEPLEVVAGSEDLAESIPEGCEPAPAKGKGRAPRKGKAPVSKATETYQTVKTEEQPKVRRGRTAAAKK